MAKQARVKHVDISLERFEALREQFLDAALLLQCVARTTAIGMRIRRRDLQAEATLPGRPVTLAPLIEALFGPTDCESHAAQQGGAQSTSAGRATSASGSHTGGSPPCDGPATHSWRGADCTVVGAAHLRCHPPLPCQDAAIADAAGRPVVIVADGAGSAPLSHLGAWAVVRGLYRLARSVEPQLASLLDGSAPDMAFAEALAAMFVRHAQGIQADMAAEHVRSPCDFRSTLLLWLVGARSALWVKVGDGALVAASASALNCIGPTGKGEFANQTTFIFPDLPASAWSSGVVSAEGLDGFAAMSDGAAERLVSNDGQRVAGAVGTLFRGLGEGDVGRRELFALLSEESVWKATTGDDKAMAMVAATPIASTSVAERLTPGEAMRHHTRQDEMNNPPEDGAAQPEPKPAVPVQDLVWSTRVEPPMALSEPSADGSIRALAG